MIGSFRLRRWNQRACLAGAAAVVALSCALPAQTVRGTVTSGASVPVPGVLVELIDGSARPVAHAVSNERGAFRLESPKPGVFRVQARRIGFKPSLSDPVTLVAGGEVERSIVLHGIAISLDTMRVAGRSACRAVVDSSTSAFAVWEQARTALAAVQATDASRALFATTATYQRTLASERRADRHSVRVRSDYVRQPWRTIAPESLHRSGYVTTSDYRVTSYSTNFYAPGLDMLLSPHFIEDHCFRLVRGPGQLGLAFQPSSDRRRIPEIRGTLWLDAASSELRRMDFQYVNVRPLEEEEGRGYVDFRRFANGAWAITAWGIRMPLVEHIVRPGIGAEDRVAEITEVGGWLALARQGNDTLWAQPPITFNAIAVDSVSGTPLSGVRVAVQGTSLHAVSDGKGIVTIAGILPGEYSLELRTLSLDSIHVARRVPVAVTGEPTPIRLRIPRLLDVAKTICGPRRDVPTGFLFGTAAAARTTVTVSAEWPAAAADSSPSPRAWTEARTEADGTFRLCNIPTGVPVELRARDDRGAIVSAAQARIAEGQLFERVTLEADTARRLSVLAGRIIVDVTQQPLEGAEVLMPDLTKRASSNANGAFRLTDVPPGSHRVLVRRVGFTPFDTSVVFGTADQAPLRIVLSRVTALDSVVVVDRAVERRMASFEENRRAALGRFLTGTDLGALGDAKLTIALQQVPGLRLIRGTNDQAWAASGRAIQSLAGASLRRPDDSDARRGAPRACYAQVYVDGAPAYHGRDGEPLFDLNALRAGDIEGVEYYAGGARTPLRYSNEGSSCGVLVLWLR